MTENIAIIPARGGSKRIPRKNIKEFGGKPIISWSIETAIKSHLFDRVIVSTDDDEIANIAKNSGAEVPFIRPSELSNDYIGMTDVVSHTIDVLDLESQKFNSVCCISATAPFMSQSHLIEGFNALRARGCNYVFSACSFPSNIFRSFAISSDGDVKMYFQENYEKRTQDLPEAYFDAAQFYWGTKEAWVEERMLFSRDSSAVLIPRYLVHDIDTPEDWQNAEIFFKNFFKK